MSDRLNRLAWDISSKKRVPLDCARERLTRWLVGMQLAAFEYAAGFNLRFERANPDQNAPAVLRLDILSSARVGDVIEWSAFCRDLPIAPRRTSAEEPALAYRLLLLVGVSITDTRLEENGTLLLTTSDEEIIMVEGCVDDRAHLIDTSWAVYASVDTQTGDGRSIHCNSSGEISLG